MTSEEIIEKLYGDYKNYGCNSLVIDKLSKEPGFKETIEEGIKSGMINGFTEEMWEKMRNLNLRVAGTLEDSFRNGSTLGACTVAIKYLSFIFPICEIAGGINANLIGTKNSVFGEHTWLIYQDKIYDTTFMMIINKEYSDKMGYILENKYNPNKNSYYNVNKEFANDPSIRKESQRKIRI